MRYKYTHKVFMLLVVLIFVLLFVSCGDGGGEDPKYGVLRITCSDAGCMKVLRVTVNDEPERGLNRNESTSYEVVEGDQYVTGTLTIYCSGLSSNEFPIDDVVFVGADTEVELTY